LDAATLGQYDSVFSTAAVNTRYDGNMPYWSSDSSGTGTETGFELGLAKINDLSGTPAAEYYHTDMLGTTRFLTDETGAAIGSAAYTAFGELVSGTTGRFGYVGAHGYQTATSDTPADPYLTDMTFQHVGARYYDPSSGRFLQRDPTGISDGDNVYLYVQAKPTRASDPSGLGLLDWLYTGSWTPAPGAYNAAVDGAARYLQGGQLPNYSKAIAGGGGAAAGVASGLAGPLASKAFGVCLAGYGVWRLEGGSTGLSAVDEALDYFAIGGGVGATFGPAATGPGSAPPLLWELLP